MDEMLEFYVGMGRSILELASRELVGLVLLIRCWAASEITCKPNGFLSLGFQRAQVRTNGLIEAIQGAFKAAEPQDIVGAAE